MVTTAMPCLPYVVVSCVGGPRVRIACLVSDEPRRMRCIRTAVVRPGFVVIRSAGGGHANSTGRDRSSVHSTRARPDPEIELVHRARTAYPSSSPSRHASCGWRSQRPGVSYSTHMGLEEALWMTPTVLGACLSGSRGMGRDWGTLRRQADEQRDLLTRSQCLAAGLTDSFIRHRLRCGRWRRVHAGVYLTAPGRNDWLMRATASFLLAGDDAAFVRESAEYLWGLGSKEPRIIELAVPHAQQISSVPGARIVRRRGLERLIDDREYPWRTTIPVTVVDIATSGTEDHALATIARAVQRFSATVAQLRAEIGRRGRCRHGRLIQDVLADVENGAESAAEIRYIRDVERAHGLPTGERQATTSHGASRRHDTRYAAYRLLVEIDGRLGHESWQDRVRDGRRDRQVLPAEGATLRVFWTDVAVTPCATAIEIGAALTAGGWDGHLHPCRRATCVVAVPGRPHSPRE